MNVTLEQWAALIAVVEQGGYAQAAEFMNKSQSSVSYAIQKLETQLNVRVFTISGRKATLTSAGETLYRRATALIQEAEQIESVAEQFASGWEPEIAVAMDSLYPQCLMLDIMNTYTETSPMTRIEWRETVLSGSEDALISRNADIVIGGRVPPGFLGQPLMHVTLRAVAAPNHPLHHLDRELNLHDLRFHRQLVVMDSGKGGLNRGWLGAQKRLSVSHIGLSIQAAVAGMGYAWLPVGKIRTELAEGRLKPLPLEAGGERTEQLYLIYSDQDYSGPATRQLGKLIKEKTEAFIKECEKDEAY
jgi:DNA-binding transcriptional LysR family regulator